jgi:diguanylate cyclase (GGDEF)-like protein
MNTSRAPRRDSTPLIYTVYFLLPLCSCLLGTQLNLPAVAIALSLPQIAAAAWIQGGTGAISASVASILGWYVMPMMGRMPLEQVDHNSAILGTVIALAYGLLVNGLHTTIERAHMAAGTDSLTGLLNRNGFVERINNEMNRGARMGGILAIGFIDCDHFKKFNDTNGHMAGDEFLISTARRLRQSVRSYDGVARFGGDEFALLFPEIDPEKIDIVVRRIQDQLKSMVKDANWPISFSMGVVVFKQRRPVEEMLRKADETMYEVKRTGKDNYLIRIDDTPEDHQSRRGPLKLASG